MPRDAKEPTLATRPVNLAGTRTHPRTPIYERAYIYKGERWSHGGLGYGIYVDYLVDAKLISNCVKLGRVTNFANWSPDMLPNQHQTPLCCEYWCDFDEDWQKSEDEFLKQAERDLRKIKLLDDEKVYSSTPLCNLR